MITSIVILPNNIKIIKRIMAAHFAKRNTKFGGGGKRGRAKIPSPQPPSFLPARVFRFCTRSAQSFGVLLKKCSNFVQKTPPNKITYTDEFKNLVKGVDLHLGETPKKPAEKKSTKKKNT